MTCWLDFVLLIKELSCFVTIWHYYQFFVTCLSPWDEKCWEESRGGYHWLVSKIVI